MGVGVGEPLREHSYATLPIWRKRVRFRAAVRWVGPPKPDGNALEPRLGKERAHGEVVAERLGTHRDALIGHLAARHVEEPRIVPRDSARGTRVRPRLALKAVLRDENLFPSKVRARAAVLLHVARNGRRELRAQVRARLPWERRVPDEKRRVIVRREDVELAIPTWPPGCRFAARDDGAQRALRARNADGGDEALEKIVAPPHPRLVHVPPIVHGVQLMRHDKVLDAPRVGEAGVAQDERRVVRVPHVPRAASATLPPPQLSDRPAPRIRSAVAGPHRREVVVVRIEHRREHRGEAEALRVRHDAVQLVVARRAQRVILAPVAVPPDRVHRRRVRSIKVPHRGELHRVGARLRSSVEGELCLCGVEREAGVAPLTASEDVAHEERRRRRDGCERFARARRFRPHRSVHRIPRAQLPRDAPRLAAPRASEVGLNSLAAEVRTQHCFGGLAGGSVVRARRSTAARVCGPASDKDSREPRRGGFRGEDAEEPVERRGLAPHFDAHCPARAVLSAIEPRHTLWADDTVRTALVAGVENDAPSAFCVQRGERGECSTAAPRRRDVRGGEVHEALVGGHPARLRRMRREPRVRRRSETNGRGVEADVVNCRPEGKRHRGGVCRRDHQFAAERRAGGSNQREPAREVCSVRKRDVEVRGNIEENDPVALRESGVVANKGLERSEPLLPLCVIAVLHPRPPDIGAAHRGRQRGPPVQPRGVNAPRSESDVHLGLVPVQIDKRRERYVEPKLLRFRHHRRERGVRRRVQGRAWRCYPSDGDARFISHVPRRFESDV